MVTKRQPTPANGQTAQRAAALQAGCSAQRRSFVRSLVQAGPLALNFAWRS